MLEYIAISLLVSVLVHFAFRAIYKDYPIICSWCQKEIRRVNHEGSHGICQDCLRKQEKELEVYDKLKGDEQNGNGKRVV